MNVQKFAQKGIVVYGGSVLVIKYGEAKYQSSKVAGKYGFPGGKIEMGESVDSSLITEIFDETGVKVKPGKPIYVWNWEYKKGDDLIQINAVMRICFYESGNVGGEKKDLESEIKYSEWVPINKLSELNFIQDERPGLEKFLKDRDFYLLQD